MDSLLGRGQCQLRTRLSRHLAKSLRHSFSFLWGGIIRECAHPSGLHLVGEWELSTFRTIPSRPEGLDSRLDHRL